MTRRRDESRAALDAVLSVDPEFYARPDDAELAARERKVVRQDVERRLGRRYVTKEDIDAEHAALKDLDWSDGA